MFKVYFLLESAGDPFLYRGDEALAQVQSVFPNAVGYVQSRALAEQIDDRPAPPYSGSAELWFRYASHAVAAVKVDLTGLLIPDARRKASVVGTERVVMRLPSHLSQQHIKGIFAFSRKEGMDPEAFQHHWWHNHGPIAALTEEALCYIQVHTLLQCYETGQPAIDGITELHWADRFIAARSMQSRQMREDQGNDAANFADPESIELFLVEEEVIIAP